MKLKEFRKAKGWTQKELADRCGLSQRCISNLETEDREGKISTLKKIAAALEIPLSKLVDDN